MIEVANRAELTLVNITLDDKFRTEGTEFVLAGNSQEPNENKVQDGIIASYGDGNSTIILGSGTILKNFGGLSAVYITGLNGAGANLIMNPGSKICDDPSAERKGGYAAIFNHGGTVTMEDGSSIENVSGRAIYIDNAGVTTVNGVIKNITSNDVMEHSTDTGPSSSNFGGIVAYVDGSAVFTLGSKGSITDIWSYNNDQGDTLFYLNGGTVKTEQYSQIFGIQTIGIVDSNGGTTQIGGSITGCETKNVFFRLRGGNTVTFELLESGSITNNKTADVGLIYRNGGKINVNIAGTIDGFNKPVLYLSSNNNVKDGTITVASTGKIKNITATAIKAESSGTLVIKGEISNCTGYAVTYEPKANQSLFEIASTATIKDNNKGKAQIQVIGSLTATNQQEHAVIATEGLVGNKTIDLKAFDVTLDDNDSPIKLGNANSSAVNTIKDSVQTQHADWTVIGSSALWFQPSGESIHFVISNLSGVQKTGLFAAWIPLNESGAPAVATLKEVTNSESIDVTLDGLTVGQSYALMFVNNKQYTLCPDDVTVYTGGGQDDAKYDNGGFPELTLYNCIDKIDDSTEVTIGDTSVSGDAAYKMKVLADQFKVTYTDATGNIIKNDETPGEYTATMAWKNGAKEITIGGNDVKDTFEAGTLIIRHTEDKEEAEEGTNTYRLLTSETPEKAVTHAEAFANNPYGLEPTFYINGDTNREIAKEDSKGISILDDSLLLEHENDNRQQLMEEKAVEFLGGSAGAGKTYAFDFHYLDLVDTYNGNAWVSASYGTTVYLPYPAGTNSETEFTLIHYKDLHREYGISGQANVEQAIRACELEKVDITRTDYGIKFDVDRSGFSPFALVWKVDAHTITATAGPGGSINPSGKITVGDGMGKYFTITPDSGYRISDVKVDGVSQGNITEYNFVNVISDRTIEAYFSKDSSGGDGGGTVTPTEHTLRFETNGGKLIEEETRKTTWTMPYEDLPVPVRDGYVFMGWYRNSTLTMPVTGDVKVYGTVTLYAKWSEDTGLTPDDTGVSHWLNTEDHFAYLQGMPNNSFGPGQNITRAEVAQMFYNLLLNKNVTTTVSFTDVAADAWYADAVNALASMGILNGVGGGKFDPTRNITRAEFTAIAMRFADLDTNGFNPFSDINANDWFYAEVVGAVQYGWIKGFTDGTFRPYLSITRAEVTVITNRMLGRSADQAYVDKHSDELRQFSDVGTDNWAYYDIAEATNSHDYVKSGSGERWQ